MSFFKTVIASAVGTVIGLMMMGVIFFLLIAMLIAGVMATQSAKEISANIEDKTILAINVEGSLEERRLPTDIIEDILSGERSKDIGLYEMEKALQAAAKDDKITGIYLRLRGVSAGWAKVESFRKQLLAFKESGKFIYAYSEGYDEKLYFIATAATEILLYPKGDFEWNGIYSQSQFFKKTLEKLDLEPNLIRAGKFKSAGEMVTQEKMSEENRLQVSAITNSVWAHVIDEIAKARTAVTADKLNMMAQELSVTTAAHAYNEKLVDQLIPIEDVEALLMKVTELKDEDEPRLINWYSYYEKQLADEKSKGDQVAVIIADGEIHSGKGSDTQTIYSDELSGLIRDLAKDDEVKAVVLRVNSPGGSALASDVIWRSLEALKKKNKKLVTSFSDVAASGGYYIAAGSDYIYAEPTTITGSIGVFGLIFNSQKFFDNKLGMTFDEVKTHTSADLMSGVRRLTPFEHERIQSDVNSTYKTFLSVVHQGRKKLSSIEDVSEVAEGRVWIGEKALEIDLVDEMGSLNAAIHKAAELAQMKDYRIVVYPDQKKFFDRLVESIGEAWVPQFLRSAWVWVKPSSSTTIYTRIPYNIQM